VSGAQTIPNIDLPRQTVDVDFQMRKYPYLPRDVLKKPRVLIGQANQTLMVAREVVEPDPLGLTITKTKLERPQKPKLCDCLDMDNNE
jgi:hypothetical protein